MTGCTCRVPISSTASSRSRTARSRSCASLQTIFDHGRLGGTGYVSILPVDQGIEHSAGASFRAEPDYFDPANIVKLAIEGGCNAVASTLGVLGACARRYAHRIPFIVKLNHNEFLSYPNTYDQIMFGAVQQAVDMGASPSARRSTSAREESRRQIQEVSEAFQEAHELGHVRRCSGATCGTPRSVRRTAADYHLAADLTGQANHLGVTIEADIIKQKLPETTAAGFPDLKLRQDRQAGLLRAARPITRST